MSNKRLGNTGFYGTETVIVTVTPVLTSSTDDSYVANDYVGTSSSPMEFEHCASSLGGSGWVTRCVMIDNAVQAISGELWLFDTTVTPPVDSAAWSISDADAAHCIGVIPMDTYYSSALNSVCVGVPLIPLFFKCGTTTESLYGCFVTRGAPNYDIDSLTFRLNVLQD